APSLRGPVLEDVEADTAQGSRHYRLIVLGASKAAVSVAVKAGMAEYFASNPDVKYILFGGKGGLGKTTLSAATAYWLASREKRVCVFSTDPQASLSDIFERKVFGQGEVELAANLYAVEIDADRRIAEYQEEIRKKAGEYGEAATVMGSKGSLAQEDLVLKELEYIRGRLDFVSTMVRDRKHTAFFYVLIPELMPILDTRKALEMFREFNVTVSGVVVNQVYPKELKDQPDVPVFLKNKISSQQEYVKQIQSEFGSLIKGIVPMLDREPKGMKMISNVAD